MTPGQISGKLLVTVNRIAPTTRHYARGKRLSIESFDGTKIRVANAAAAMELMSNERMLGISRRDMARHRAGVSADDLPSLLDDRCDRWMTAEDL